MCASRDWEDNLTKSASQWDDEPVRPHAGWSSVRALDRRESDMSGTPCLALPATPRPLLPIQAHLSRHRRRIPFDFPPFPPSDTLPRIPTLNLSLHKLYPDHRKTRLSIISASVFVGIHAFSSVLSPGSLTVAITPSAHKMNGISNRPAR
ncbi:hypothetical protein DL93DRAFT_501565 [Clavulina sp. PMI_390]|nr:hypothetical protein DL93DRAFT_501565 [Clavulina sp. PMI_390]